MTNKIAIFKPKRIRMALNFDRDGTLRKNTASHDRTKTKPPTNIRNSINTDINLGKNRSIGKCTTFS